MEHLESPGYLQSFHKSVLGARPSAARSSFNTVRYFLIFSYSKQPSTVVWSQISEAQCGDHVLPEFSHKLPGNADFQA